MKSSFPKDTLTKIVEIRRFVWWVGHMGKKLNLIQEYHSYVYEILEKFLFMKELEILDFISTETNKIKIELDKLEKNNSDEYNLLESKYQFLLFLYDYLDIDEEVAELRAKRVVRNATIQDLDLIRKQCEFSDELLNRSDFRLGASTILIDDNNKIWGLILCGTKCLAHAFNLKCTGPSDPWYYDKESCELLGVYFAPDYIPESNEIIDLYSTLKSPTGYWTLYWMRNSSKTCSDELLEEFLDYRDDVTEIDIWTKPG